MLTRLELCSFQCHEHRVFDLEKITVFVGENDVGKSTILRAVKWLLLNAWDDASDSFIRWGDDRAIVTGTVDGEVVSRIKGGGDNIYLLNEQEFRAFHPNRPGPVVDLVRMGRDNFQDQDEPPFWLALTSGQAASALNEIFNLSVIDTALGKASQEVRGARARVAASEERLVKLRLDKKKLDWIVEADKVLREMEELDDRIQASRQEERKLNWGLLQLQEMMRREETAGEVFRLANKAIEVGEGIIAHDKKIKKVRELLCLEERLSGLVKALYTKEERLRRLMLGKCPMCNRSGPVR